MVSCWSGLSGPGITDVRGGGAGRHGVRPCDLPNLPLTLFSSHSMVLNKYNLYLADTWVQ